MAHTGLPFDTLPPPLKADALALWSRFVEQRGPEDALKIPQRIAESIPLILAVSPFVAQEITRTPSLLNVLINQGLLEKSRAETEILAWLKEGLVNVTDEGGLQKALRKMRSLEMVRIAWRDIAGWAPIEETLRDLSLLAEAAVETALKIHFDWLTERFGIPQNREGEPQNLVVLGMGKLGARELNYSSDIDLILAYRDDGVLTDKKETSYAEFYTRLARNLVRALDEKTEDGFVFRVDTRLRPFGESGPLVLHFEALERYYEGQAREWERYAMIKARAIAGDPRGGPELERFLHPFVYRRYLDFRAFGELRELKRMISQELARKGDHQNVKLGKGGIREIEFIGQAFQLIRGGSEKSLQRRDILGVLSALGTLGLLPEETVTELKSHYRTLRIIENRLQEYRDQQTHTLPPSEGQQRALAYALGYDDYPAFLSALSTLQSRVHQVFEDVIRIDADSGKAPFPLDGDAEALLSSLLSLGIKDPETLVPKLEGFRSASSIRRLSPRGASEIRRLLPDLLKEIHTLPHRLETLDRLFKVLEAIASRNVYLTLLAENPGARTRLVALVGASPWFATTLGRHPVLLDELLDPRSFSAPITREALEIELDRKLESQDPEDLEAFMIALRHYRQVVILRIAAADIAGSLPLPEVSNALTALAETLLQAALARSVAITRQRHGSPGGLQDPAAGFAVIAYGKLGGLELGYGSDLDLVFLYAGDTEAETDGPKPVTAGEFYARLAQRILHIMGTNTPAGILYETDLRLRPSGNSGLLVSSLEAFETYQMQEAWTWEQQALVKARFVAGDPLVGKKFKAIRARSLGRLRDATLLRQEIVEMRGKMRAVLETQDPNLFDLKQGAGGIVDIEFLVQFWVLAWSNAHPRLTEWTDVLRLLERLKEEHLIPEKDQDFLQQAYFTLRNEAHRAQLDERKAVVAAQAFAPLRERIQALWAAVLKPKGDFGSI
ncbi:MAG: hypothetical protein RLZ25_2134 [Pseudomonadota bacterium]